MNVKRKFHPIKKHQQQKLIFSQYFILTKSESGTDAIGPM